LGVLYTRFTKAGFFSESKIVVFIEIVLAISNILEYLSRFSGFAVSSLCHTTTSPQTIGLISDLR
jgi:hypothetical protein